MTEMVKPASRIFVNDSEIVDKEKNGQYTEYILSDGTRVRKSQLGKIKIKCQECATLKEISLYFKIYEKKYVCMSCQRKGERNHFFGKTHSEELKAKLSQERKGTWGVGESNAMFGKSVKDFVTPEKFEEMREKNRQDSLNRVDNPFRKSMREVIGDERFEAAMAKKVITQANWSEEKKAAHSEKLKAAAKRVKDRDPAAYSAMKAKGGIAARSKAINYEMNNFETKVSEWLTSQSIRHTYSAIMSNGTKNYQFDFLLHDYRILLECNGTYWHGDPRFFTLEENHSVLRKLNQTQLNNIEKDKLKKEYAASKGFKLVVLWEEDVNNNDYAAITKELEK